MSLEDSSQKNLDKVGGIIATGVFALCLLLHIWRWLRYKCHALAATTIYLILRTVGWLLAFIGAFKNDSLLNKRGYIVNSLAFWLFIFGSMLLVVQWDTSRRGVKRSRRSNTGAGLALLLCLVMGALEAAGQITWLNAPEDDPNTILKVAEVGFVALTGIYGLFAIFFNYKESMIYQQPSVRWTFILTASLLICRSVFWMLVALHAVKFTEAKRLIFLYCLTTVPEMVAAAIWGISPATKHIQPPLNVDLAKPTSIASGDNNSNKPLRGGPASPIHRLSESDPRNGVQDKASIKESANDGDANDIDQSGTNQPGAFGSYSSTYQSNGHSGTVGTAGTSSSYSSPYMQQQQQQDQTIENTFVANPWANVPADPMGTGATNSPGMPATIYDPRPLSYNSQNIQLAPVAQYPNTAPSPLQNQQQGLQRYSLQHIPVQQPSPLQQQHQQQQPQLQRISLQQLPQQQILVSQQQQQQLPRMSIQQLPQQHIIIAQQPLLQQQGSPFVYQQSATIPHQSVLVSAAPSSSTIPVQTVNFVVPAQTPQAVSSAQQHPHIVRTPYPPASAIAQGNEPLSEIPTPAFHNDYFDGQANRSTASMQNFETTHDPERTESSQSTPAPSQQQQQRPFQ
ncbi:hypothetical protein LPJ64_000235 [Coemansia asiatica]|uniref:Uncharacterized protein n=1 Tax=Coemansia asiatica TaxID=1052880 RepID=A0A9W8CL41_9FUNG|nr:hypothetical protein LPJ64_000235 [Coemansia asiatica]